MEQLLLHLLGDYIAQSHWMAINKVKSWFPAAIHATVYSLPFLAIGSLSAVAVILSTHFLIDRYRLARYVVFAKKTRRVTETAMGRVLCNRYARRRPAVVGGMVVDYCRQCDAFDDQLPGT